MAMEDLMVSQRMAMSLQPRPFTTLSTNHLMHLTREEDTRSLPMAITQALQKERSWKGMGLVAGSKLSDVDTA